MENTTPSTVPADDDLVGIPAPPPRSSGPSLRRIVVSTLAVVIAGAAVFVAFARASTLGVEDYILAPGSATDTAPAVIVSGAETFPPEGEIAFTTVSIRRNITVWEWFVARFDDSSEFVPAEQIDGTRTREETREVTQFQMDVSQDTAALVALNFLGYEIVPEVDGAFVVELVRDSPAEQTLHLGDLITEVNGEAIRSSADLGDAIRSLAPGDDVDITLRRGDLEQGADGSDSGAATLELALTLADHPEVENAGFLGVRIETPVRADAPFEVRLDVGRVRGPSAGLAFSLAILDVLTEGELTGGLKMATTGTISPEGIVGAVGGVPQKIAAAKREGIELFLVPPSEYEDALKASGNDLAIRCVQTFEDAVLVLVDFGGNGMEVAAGAGVPAPEFSPSPIDDNDGFLSCAEVIGVS